MMSGQGLTLSVSFRFSALFLGAILSLGVTSAWAQTSQVGTVSGQVTDEQGGAVPGAAIRLTDISTNAAQQTNSNADGRYAFPSVTPGTYSIAISKEGFNGYEVNRQAVEIGQVLTINATLKVGSTSTTVEVSA